LRFTVELPLSGDAAEPRAVTDVARAAEDAGIAMVAFTDHPAPSAKWLHAGGHPTFDPFAALAYVAAVTTRVRLATHLAVLPYRNPLLLAKSVATVDRLSGGRFTLVVGTGYLRSEFAALGRSFEDRNALFDEAMAVLRTVFVDDAFTYEGSDFAAHGVAHAPKPVQLPHPPVWLGGSSRASRVRVARYGEGWAPLYVDEVAARVVRTAPLGTDDRLREAIDDLRSLLEAEGRDPSRISIQLDGAVSMDRPAAEVGDRAGELAALGVTHLVVRPPHGHAEAMAAAIRRFGDEVIAPVGSDVPTRS
jgi:probable F420-dependent oxidoreductase